MVPQLRACAALGKDPNYVPSTELAGVTPIKDRDMSVAVSIGNIPEKVLELRLKMKTTRKVINNKKKPGRTVVKADPSLEHTERRPHSCRSVGRGQSSTVPVE